MGRRLAWRLPFLLQSPPRVAKAPPIEEQVLALGALRADPKSDTTRAALAKALAGKSNLLAAKAAELASELQVAGLLPDLETSFPRYFANGADKGCVAKTAIAHALETLSSDAEDLFLRGVRHVQPEGTWGGSIDVAVDLRAACARALSRLNTRNTLPALTDLLGDPEPPARLAAAQAIGHCGRPEGALPLRLKIRLGDPEPAVTGECFAALLKLIGEDAIPLIEPFLAHRQSELRDAAATALGESHLASGYALLRDRFDREITVDGRRALLFGLALSRRPESLDLLLTVIDEEPTPTAVHAIESLAIYRNDPAVSTRIRALVDARGDAALNTEFTKHFAPR
jgi:HEAT repeat protein